MITGKARIECPFCHKTTVVAFHKPQHREMRVSRISAGSKVKWHIVPEKYFIQSDCPDCGAKKKDIQDYYDGKYQNKISHEERLKMWKKRGLPLVLKSES